MYLSQVLLEAPVGGGLQPAQHKAPQRDPPSHGSSYLPAAYLPH